MPAVAVAIRDLTVRRGGREVVCDSLHRVAADGSLGSQGIVSVAVIAGATVLALVLGAATLRRRTA